MKEMFLNFFRYLKKALDLVLNIPVEDGSNITFGNVLMALILIALAFAIIFYNKGGGKEK